jgi:4-hydroxybenzoate polyprenyltransferase
MCLVEARPEVLMIFFLRFSAGIVLSAEAIHAWSPARLLACALTWELAVFAIYLFNGVMDIQEDRINGSRRPIARGALPAGLALRISVCAAAASVAGSVALALPTAWTIPALLALGYLYSGPPCRLKRRPIATAVTGAIAGLLSYYTGFAAQADAGWTHPGTALPVFAVAMSLWMGFVGGLTKDLPDAEGDAAAGRRTMAVVCASATVRLTAATAALALALSFCVAALHFAHLLVASSVVMLGGGIGVAIVCLSKLSQGSRSRRRRPYRMFMTTQLAVHTHLSVAYHL